MKGDKNRGEKLFSKIVLGDKFQKGIQEIRAKSKIPEKGFSNIEELSKWYYMQSGGCRYRPYRQTLSGHRNRSVPKYTG